MWHIAIEVSAYFASCDLDYLGWHAMRQFNSPFELLCREEGHVVELYGYNIFLLLIMKYILILIN